MLLMNVSLKKQLRRCSFVRGRHCQIATWKLPSFLILLRSCKNLPNSGQASLGAQKPFVFLNQYTVYLLNCSIILYVSYSWMYSNTLTDRRFVKSWTGRLYVKLPHALRSRFGKTFFNAFIFSPRSNYWYWRLIIVVRVGSALLSCWLTLTQWIHLIKLSWRK